MSGPSGSLRGRLLVATPPLVDPNFDRTVVLMLEHGDDGALGIVLNRPSETVLDDVLPEWYAFASLPAVLFAGGPVAPDAVIALARDGTTRHCTRPPTGPASCRSWAISRRSISARIPTTSA